MEEIKLVHKECDKKMDTSIIHLISSLTNIRAGKAMPNMVDGIKVDYYGTPTPLNQVANISTPDARTISVQAWEKTLLPEIEKSIINANLGLNPQNNGEVIIISVPPLTEERRLSLVKQSKSEGEDTKISIRGIRKEANDELKNLKNNAPEDVIKDAETEVQSITNKYIGKVDKLISKKEEDIMKV